MAGAEMFTVIDWKGGGLSVLPRSAFARVSDLVAGEGCVSLLSRSGIDLLGNGRRTGQANAPAPVPASSQRADYGRGPRTDRRVWDDRAALKLIQQHPEGVAIADLGEALGIPLITTKRQVNLMFEEGLLFKLRIGKTWHVQLSDDGRAAL